MRVVQIKEFLEHVCEQIKYQPIRAEIAQEMESHLKESKEQLIAEGLTEEKAEQEAISQMGNAEEIGKKLNKIHSPKLDWKLLLLTLILIIFGALVTFTRSNCVDEKGALPYYSPMPQYIFTLAVGAVLSIGIYFFDYRKILKMPKTLYGVATCLILFAMLFGYQINGNKIYLYILGNTFFMPAIAVPLYILSFIGWLQKMDTSKNLEIAFLQKKAQNQFRYFENDYFKWNFFACFTNGTSNCFNVYFGSHIFNSCNCEIVGVQEKQKT